MESDHGQPLLFANGENPNNLCCPNACSFSETDVEGWEAERTGTYEPWPGAPLETFSTSGDQIENRILAPAGDLYTQWRQCEAALGITYTLDVLFGAHQYSTMNWAVEDPIYVITTRAEFEGQSTECTSWDEISSAVCIKNIKKDSGDPEDDCECRALPLDEGGCNARGLNSYDSAFDPVGETPSYDCYGLYGCNGRGNAVAWGFKSVPLLADYSLKLFICDRPDWRSAASAGPIAYCNAHATYVEAP
jgi:hypothetical protein